MPVAGKTLPRAVLPVLLGPGVGGREPAADPPEKPAAEPYSWGIRLSGPPAEPAAAAGGAIVIWYEAAWPAGGAIVVWYEAAWPAGGTGGGAEVAGCRAVCASPWEVGVGGSPTDQPCLPATSCIMAKRSESLTAPDRPFLWGLAALVFLGLLAFFPPFFFFFPTGGEAGDGPEAARLVPFRSPAAS